MKGRLLGLLLAALCASFNNSNAGDALQPYVQLKHNATIYGQLSKHDILGDTLIVKGRFPIENRYELLEQKPGYLEISDGDVTGWVRREHATIVKPWENLRVMIVSWNCNLRSTGRRPPFDLNEKFDLVGLIFPIREWRKSELRLPLHEGTVWIDRADVIVINQPLTEIRARIASVGSVRFLVLQAIQAIRAKDYATAARLFARVSEHEPTNPLWRVGLAITAGHLQKHVRATNHLNEALRIDPKFAYACRLRALIWKRRKNENLAIDDYVRAIDLAPRDPIAYRELALLLATSQNPKLRNANMALDLLEISKARTGQQNHTDFMLRSIVEMERGNTRRAVELISGARYLLMQVNNKRLNRERMLNAIRTVGIRERLLNAIRIVGVGEHQTMADLTKSTWKNARRYDVQYEAAYASRLWNEAAANNTKAFLADNRLIESYEKLKSAYEAGKTYREVYNAN